MANSQAMVLLKGVEDNFDKLTHIREVLEGDGDYALHAADMYYGILGMGVAYQLGMGYTYEHPLKIYAPRREGQLNMANLQEGFVEDELYSLACCSVSSKGNTISGILSHRLISHAIYSINRVCSLRWSFVSSQVAISMR